MTSTLTSNESHTRRTGRPRAATSARRGQSTLRRRAARSGVHVLASYVDARGARRQLVTKRGAAGSVLVIDRDASSRADRRLVAHLAADEPPENVGLLARRYVEDVRDAPRGCRLLTARDSRTVPFAEEERAQLAEAALLTETEPSDRCGRRYRLRLIHTGMSIPELRWSRHGGADASHGEIVSMRAVVGALESYEPVRALTLVALAEHGPDAGTSTTTLRAELRRVSNSPIVLNRGLRDAVLASVERGHLSMSEIAIRCGRVKRDRRGNESGETSWLGRRLGLLPEAGQDRPTPWIHSDVLGLIARRGLGLGPREVELT